MSVHIQTLRTNNPCTARFTRDPNALLVSSDADCYIDTTSTGIDFPAQSDYTQYMSDESAETPERLEYPDSINRPWRGEETASACLLIWVEEAFKIVNERPHFAFL